MTIHEVNEAIIKLIEEFAIKSNRLSELLQEYLQAKNNYEMAYSKNLLEQKAKDPTLTESQIKALAISLSYESKLELIKAESAFKRVKQDLKSVNDRLDALREVSYNLRRESKL